MPSPAFGAKGKALRPELLPPAAIRDVYVVHFVLDGANLRAFERALEEGRLPTVRRHFALGGTSFTHALSSFPSTSTSVYQSYATGLFPGHAGIPHLERFDRIREKPIGYLTVGGPAKLGADLINLRALLNPEVAELSPPTTIFELLAGHPTATVYSPFSRGAASVHPRRAPIHALWSTYATENGHKVDLLAMREVERLFRREVEKIPRYTLVGLYSADIAGHEAGPQSEGVQETLAQFDLFLSEFLKLLEEQGIADRSYLILSADHGMHESGELFPIRRALEGAGLSLKPRNPRVRDYTIAAAIRGVASSHLYVRHGGGFEPLDDPDVLRHLPGKDGRTVDLIELLLGLDATDLLAVRAGGRRTLLFSHDGTSAEIACTPVGEEEYCSYRFDRSRGDPLGYSREPAVAFLLDGRPHSRAAWLEGASSLAVPDGVVQLSQIFRDGRAGDLFITTRDRFGFRKVKAGNHGGAGEEDMRVPLLIAGPNVPHGFFRGARSVDLFPLLVEWFGLEVPPGNFDGVNPFAPRSPEDKTAPVLAAIEQRFEEDRSAISLPRGVRRAALAAMAHQELSRRSRLLERLGDFAAALEAPRGKGTSQLAPPDFLEDHLAIVQRMRREVRQAAQRMGEIEDCLRRKVIWTSEKEMEPSVLSRRRLASDAGSPPALRQAQ